jgi:hypothetical protein
VGGIDPRDATAAQGDALIATCCALLIDTLTRIDATTPHRQRA